MGFYENIILIGSEAAEGRKEKNCSDRKKHQKMVKYC